MESYSKRRDHTSGNRRQVVLALMASTNINNENSIKGRKIKTQQEERKKMNENQRSKQEKSVECEMKKAKRDQGSVELSVEEKRVAFLFEKGIEETLLAVLYGKKKTQKERKATEDKTKKNVKEKQEETAKEVAKKWKNARKENQEETLAVLLKKDRKRQQKLHEKESAEDIINKNNRRKIDQDQLLLVSKTKKKRTQKEAMNIARNRTNETAKNRKNGATTIDWLEDTKIATEKRCNTRKDMGKGSSADENGEVQFLLDMPEFHNDFPRVEFLDFEELMMDFGSQKKQFFGNFFVDMPESD